MRQTLLIVLGLTVLYGVTLALAAPTPILLPFAVLMAAPLVWASATDIDRLVIPNWINVSFAAGGIAFCIGFDLPIQPRVGAALSIYLVFWGIAAGYLWLRQRHGLGMGDAKLVAAGAIWVGPIGLPSSVLIGALTGIVAVLTLRLTTGRAMDAWLPFGPFLGYGLFVVWLFGPVI